ncbi:MAG TPA: winged helix-turn-helix domain-containing protein [Nitrososphaeraceae archaeon]|jgi:predicted transcriptional regulator|nr:winged helix-turn-helix domain-containing protein [Nitrososphaeraceae archaeon]
MKYRSRTEIVGLILEAANGGGATKTKIMYKAFLSFAQLREYLTMLKDNGLIEYEGGKQTYRTTEKGIGLLQIYEKMYELAPPLASTAAAETSILEQNRGGGGY